jgi:hypothetical protein
MTGQSKLALLERVQDEDIEEEQFQDEGAEEEQVQDKDTDEGWLPVSITISVQEGQAIEGWRIESIERDQIVLRQDDLVQIIKLRVGSDSLVRFMPSLTNDFYDLDMFLPGEFDDHPGRRRGMPDA